MALFQSPWVTRQRNTAVAANAGVEIAQMFEFTLPAAALAEGDIIELGVLPAHNAISGAYLVCDAAGGMEVNVGLMSGAVGEENDARTCGDEIFAAEAIAATVTPSDQVSALTITPTDADRSIGVEVTTAGTAAAGAKVRLLLKYRAV